MNKHLLCAGLLALAASVAQADPKVREMRVPFADLNPDHPAGAAALYGRIRSAARAVCENPTAPRGLLMVAPPKCMDSAIRQALLEVNRPALLAYACAHAGAPATCASTEPSRGTP